MATNGIDMGETTIMRTRCPQIPKHPCFVMEQIPNILQLHLCWSVELLHQLYAASYLHMTQ